jgi:hypothetical protein
MIDVAKRMNWGVELMMVEDFNEHRRKFAYELDIDAL